MSDKPAYPSPASVRCTAEELEWIKALADAQGLTVSALFRQAVLGKAERPRRRRRRTRRPVKDQKELARLFALLGQSKLASNLNQLARAANSGSLIVTPDVKAEINQACKEVHFMRKTLLKALDLYEDDDADGAAS